MTRITLPSAALAATLDAVRFAVGNDPELPQLSGVLFDTGKDTLTLVPSVQAHGTLAGHPFAADYAPRLPFTLTPYELAPLLRRVGLEHRGLLESGLAVAGDAHVVALLVQRPAEDTRDVDVVLHHEYTR